MDYDAVFRTNLDVTLLIEGATFKAGRAPFFDAAAADDAVDGAGFIGFSAVDVNYVRL